MNDKPRYLNTSYGYYYQVSTPHKGFEGFSFVKCPKCNNRLKLVEEKNEYKYICPKCKYSMQFCEYQKRFINTNWSRFLKKGIPLYSWRDKCPNCKKFISYITYCINTTFGDQNMCIFEPILLGREPKIDNFIMKVCNVVNMFPEDTNNLFAHIFCRHCDAPISYKNLLHSFINQYSFGLEYVIKSDQIQNIHLEPEDIDKILKSLERY